MFTKTGLRIGGEGRQILQYPADQKYWIIYSYSTYNHQYQSIVRHNRSKTKSSPI